MKMAEEMRKTFEININLTKSCQEWLLKTLLEGWGYEGLPLKRPGLTTRSRDYEGLPLKHPSLAGL